MLDLIHLRTLQQFSAVGTIAATAAALGYSASAVSQQLGALERDLSTALLERTARSATLTEAGHLLAVRAAEILGAVEAAEAEMAARSGSVQGRLVVSAIPNLAGPVAAALAQLQADHPALDLVLRENSAEQAVTDVVQYLSDLAVVDSWVSRPPRAAVGLRRYRIHSEAVGFAVRACDPLGTVGQPMTRSDLVDAIASSTWLCAPLGHGSRAASDRVLARLNVTPARRWEFEGLITVAELVVAGAGYAFLPQIVADTQHGQLRLLPMPTPMHRHIHVLTRATAAREPRITQALHVIRQRIPG